MKLSTAILKGCKIRRKTSAQLFEDNKSCALGAAYEGVTGKYNGGGELTLLRKKFPILRRVAPKSSKSWGYSETIEEIIISRNDTLGWSREKIARWLKKLGH